MRRIVLVLLLALGSTGIAHAAPRDTADPARVAEAIKLLDAEGYEAALMHSVNVGTEAMLGIMTEQLQKRSGEALPDAFLKKMRDTMRSHAEETMREQMAGVKRKTAELYAKEFTVTELARLREIASDPLIARSRSWSREVQPTMVMLGIEAMREKQGELDAKLKDLIEDYVRRLETKPTS